MSGEVLMALAMFALVASATPGPNNIMVLASGVNFGFVRTIPHMLGVLIGFAVLLSAVGAGLGVLFKSFPVLHTVLKFVGAAYLLYLAWRIAMSRSMSHASTKARPMSFLEAAAFQWVNPKGWVMGITAMSVYSRPESPLLSAAIIVAVFFLITIPSITMWTVFGTGLRGFLSDPVRLKWFNIAMGVALVASLVPMLR